MPVKISGSTLQRAAYGRIALYGDSGVGKTTFAGTAWVPPSETCSGKILLHDFDHKLDVLSGNPHVCVLSYSSDPEQARNEFFAFKKAFRAARQGKLTPSKFDGHEEETPFHIQVVDSGTSLYKMVLNAAMLSQGKYSVEIDSEDVPDMATYKNYTTFWSGLFAEWKYLADKQWTLVLFHELIKYNNPKKMGDEPTVKEYTLYLGGGKVNQELPGEMNEIWHLDRTVIGNKSKSTMLFQPQDLYRANTTMVRVPRLVLPSEEMTFQRVLEETGRRPEETGTKSHNTEGKE